jgi:hypothetical protein
MSLTQGSATMTLKSSQLAAVTRMLSFNKDSGGGNSYGHEKTSIDDTANPWKVLIYDKHTRGIISPLLSVSQLRALGVTLHLLLHSDRESIPDVPAVYFVRPTQENLAIIARDCSKHLYQRSHLHFSTRMERPVMEEFARLVVNTGGLDSIASVHDQFVEFACLENRLFTLNVDDSYVLYNDPGATESDMEMAMNGIAGGLFSVVATLGSVPVIRCPRVRHSISLLCSVYICLLSPELQHPHCVLYYVSLFSGRRTRDGRKEAQSTYHRTSHPCPIERWQSYDTSSASPCHNGSEHGFDHSCPACLNVSGTHR